MSRLSAALLVSLLPLSVIARDVIFPPVAAIHINGQSSQAPLNVENDALLELKRFAGLTTFANVPWVHCLSPEAQVEKYDIAFLGAPFDTGTTARPGARYGPSGIRRGSRRIAPPFAWSTYTHENAFLQWARIVDCGDAPLTFLDNTVALQQLEDEGLIRAEAGESFIQSLEKRGW